MPKILDNAEHAILTTARKHLFSSGYKNTSVRRIAADCGIAVGTIYNYYENKEMLIAHVIAEDWMLALENLDRACSEVTCAEEGIAVLFTSLREFENLYHDVFIQSSSSGLSMEGNRNRHLLLRRQLQTRIETVIRRFTDIDSGLLPVLTEAVLASALQPDISREQVIKLAERLL